MSNRWPPAAVNGSHWFVPHRWYWLRGGPPSVIPKRVRADLFGVTASGTFEYPLRRSGSILKQLLFDPAHLATTGAASKFNHLFIW